jgi:hypothetical protein
VAGVLADPFGGGSSEVRSEQPDARLIRALGQERTALRADLANATVPDDQATAAAALASSYRSAAARADSPDLADAAGDAADAYGELATSFREGGADSFAGASAAVSEAETRVNATVPSVGDSQDSRR